jgi:hypothetical protein
LVSTPLPAAVFVFAAAKGNQWSPESPRVPSYQCLGTVEAETLRTATPIAADAKPQDTSKGENAADDSLAS